MKPIILHLDGVSAVSEPNEQRLMLVIRGDKFVELHKLLNKALNTHENPPAWAFDLSDAMEPHPIPKPVERKTS